MLSTIQLVLDYDSKTFHFFLKKQQSVSSIHKRSIDSDKHQSVDSIGKSSS